MMDTQILDVRGLACPQPAMAVRSLIREMGQGTVTVLVDSATARDNVSRIARNAGWQVTEQPTPEGYQLMLVK